MDLNRSTCHTSLLVTLVGILLLATIFPNEVANVIQDNRISSREAHPLPLIHKFWHVSDHSRLRKLQMLMCIADEEVVSVTNHL